MPVIADDDGDGVLDIAPDNCLLDPNPSQTDSNGNGIGDACDNDNDADGIPNDSDNCIDVANTDQADYDSDGLGDACDPDDDNDTVLDGSDVCPTADDTIDNDADGEPDCSAGDLCVGDDDLLDDGNGICGCVSSNYSAPVVAQHSNYKYQLRVNHLSSAETEQAYGANWATYWTILGKKNQVAAPNTTYFNNGDWATGINYYMADQAPCPGSPLPLSQMDNPPGENVEGYAGAEEERPCPRFSRPEQRHADPVAGGGLDHDLLHDDEGEAEAAPANPAQGYL